MSEPLADKLWANEKIDDIVDNHIFLDNGTSTYGVWEDRANKYLRQMRDEYEQALAAAASRIAELERELAEAKSDAEYWHDTFMAGDTERGT